MVFNFSHFAEIRRKAVYIKSLMIFYVIVWLKGQGNIVQMTENGVNLVAIMLDVQLKIIWKFE